MKEQVKLPLLVAVIVIAVGIFGYFGMKAMSAGDLDQGQVKYTPGKPPWMESDPSKRGPGSGPPPVQTSQPNPGMAGGPPPGMSAPVLGNGK